MVDGGPVGETARRLPVVLVGLMGAGKSTVGRVLTDLAWSGHDPAAFVDLDAEIESATGSSIAELFARSGEEAFRRLEAATLSEVLGRFAGRAAVVATGGGSVLDAGSRRRLGQVRTVWLRARPSTLAARVGPDPERPLLGDDPVAALQQLAARRAPLYAEVAEVVIDVDGLTAAAAADAVLRRLGLASSDHAPIGSTP